MKFLPQVVMQQQIATSFAQLNISEQKTIFGWKKDYHQDFILVICALRFSFDYFSFWERNSKKKEKTLCRIWCENDYKSCCCSTLWLLDLSNKIKNLIT